MKKENIKLIKHNATVFLLVFFITTLTSAALASEKFDAADETDNIEQIELTIQKSNPFDSDTEIIIEIKDKCRASFSVCTPLDAVVRQWASRDMKPGKHIIKWDGRDNAGRLVASGVYLVKIQTQHCHRTEMLALLQ